MRNFTKLKRYLFDCMRFFLGMKAYGQAMTISGKVSSQDGESFPSATVLKADTSYGLLTSRIGIIPSGFNR